MAAAPGPGRRGAWRVSRRRLGPREAPAAARRGCSRGRAGCVGWRARCCCAWAAARARCSTPSASWRASRRCPGARGDPPGRRWAGTAGSRGARARAGGGWTRAAAGGGDSAAAAAQPEPEGPLRGQPRAALPGLTRGAPPAWRTRPAAGTALPFAWPPHSSAALGDGWTEAAWEEAPRAPLPGPSAEQARLGLGSALGPRPPLPRERPEVISPRLPPAQGLL